MVIPTLKTCYFEASEDIKTKFKSQALHIIRIKYWNAGVSGYPPFLIPALWNKGHTGQTFLARVYLNYMRFP